VNRKRTFMLVCLALAVIAVLFAIASPRSSEAHSLATGVGALSGGKYVLSLQPAQVSEPGGYRLLDAPALVDTAAGCCCKNCLPFVRK